MNDIFPKDYPDFQEFGDPPCAESFPDAFFPEDAPDGSLSKRGTYLYEREAKTICSSCPYMRACLEYALKNPDLMGIWGGSNDRERKAIRKGIRVNLSMPPSRNRRITVE